MHFNGKTYADKPPLFFWLIGLSSYLFGGFTSFSARFPAALFGTLTVILTFIFGRRLYGSRTGFLSGMVLATSIEFAYLSTRANIDTTLTFFTTASLLCFFQWHRYTAFHLGSESKRSSHLPPGEREGVRLNRFGQKENKNLFIYGFYISMALATLTKGPVGFILPLLLSLIYLIIQKDWKRLKEMKLFPGMLLFAVIVLSWYLPAVLKGGKAYLNETLFQQTINRYSGGWSHARPIYYYFYNFPVEFLPWFLFLPAAMVYGYSKEMFEKRREFLFLLVWFVVIFLFFSLSKGKRGLYILPLYPAASLMVGKLWDDLLSSRMEYFRHGWIFSPLYLLMGLALLAGAAIPWVVSMKFPSYLPYSLPMAFLMVGGSLAMFVLQRVRNHSGIFLLIIAIMAGGFFYTLRVVFPLINPYKSARFISQEITSRIQPNERLCIYGGFGTGPYNYYTGIVPILELKKREDLLNVLQSQEKVFCLLKYQAFSSLQGMEGRPEIQWIARRKVGDDDIVLISNQ